MTSSVLDSLATETLRALVDARGPLTVEAIRARLSERHGGYWAYATVYTRASRLVLLGLAESRADSFPALGHRSRIFWPTPAGEATIHPPTTRSDP